MKQMNQILSKKIKMLSFVTMIMVLFIHSFNLTLYPMRFLSLTSYSFQIQNFISFHICRIAVPFFFILSGFLFAYNFNLTIQNYGNKLRSRIHSLVIPFFLWISLWSIFFLILSYLPFFASYINKPINFDSNPLILVFNMYWKPICYQFWFLKDLIFLILFTPILILSVRKIPYLVLPILYYILVNKTVDFVIFNQLSIFYFSVGIFISFHYAKIEAIFSKLNYIFIGILWILLYFYTPWSIINYAIQFNIFIGILFIWKFYDIINQQNAFYLNVLNWSKYSFFLFAFHEPIQISFKKIGFTILGKTEAVSLILYFLIPILVFLISINVGKYTQKLFPKIYSVLTGGR